MHKTVKLTFQQEEIDFSVLTAFLTLRQTRRSAAAKTDSQSLKVTGRVWTFITLIWHNLVFVGVQLGNFNQWSAVSSWTEIGLMCRASASLQDTDTANKLPKFRTLFPSDEGNWLDRDADEYIWLAYLPVVMGTWWMYGCMDGGQDKYISWIGAAFHVVLS